MLYALRNFEALGKLLNPELQSLQMQNNNRIDLPRYLLTMYLSKSCSVSGQVVSTEVISVSKRDGNTYSHVSYNLVVIKQNAHIM